MVRTHTIFSPTQPEMIEANHPNACNLCHLDKSIDWTVEHLGRWYGAEFSEQALEQNYPDRDAPVGRGWLNHEFEAVRLVAADALARGKSEWALPQLIDSLDDPYLLNRQFTQIALEEMLGVDLSEYGYRFYMTSEERREPLERMRSALTESK